MDDVGLVLTEGCSNEIDRPLQATHAAFSNHTTLDTPKVSAVTAILGSEFFWGILIGAVLTVFGACISVYIQNIQRRKLINRFCQDAASNLAEHIQGMDDHRDRARQIHHEFIALIEAELQVVMKNKEHMVHISDEDVRRRVRNFFNAIAITVVNMRRSLDRFYEASRMVKVADDEAARHRAAEEASATLADAHRACDRLVSLSKEAKDLRNGLK